ncbi:hypothetical protein D9756_010283 [Leucocoprinus leucothites]|uniref:Large ribosomal subunit protein mL59 domain-containing protein n=1 Tax=Leucocoprinus leucothites TaxID=201217 RepID=A0A8H5CW54_9AGAR|nr:hypothetical protein D9756_010283 [Leucoagaricus leucothites]
MSNLAAVNAVKKFRLEAISKLRPIRQPPLPSGLAPKVRQNPFIAQKLPNGKWREPVYSLRKQAEIVKAAKASGLLHLIPTGPKNPLPRAPAKGQDVKAIAVKRAAEQESVMEQLKKELMEKGEKDVGWLNLNSIAWRGKAKRRERKELVSLYPAKKRMFKGHKWQRTQEQRERKRGILMRDMKKRIYNYKMFYRRRRPDPLKPARTIKAPKLPF